MLNKLIKKITAYFCDNNIIEKEDAEIYAYGLFILFTTVFELASVVIISIIFNVFFAAAVFIISFILLRVNAGGYHASTVGRCYLVLLIAFLIYLISLRLPLPYVPIAIVISILSEMTIIKFAPMDNPNKRLSEKNRKKSRRMSIIIVSAETFVVMLLALSKSSISFYIAYGQLAVAASLLAVKIKEKREFKCQEK